MSRDTMTFPEIIDLLNGPPSLARTLEYITRRGCRPYPPFGGRIDDLAAHTRDLTRRCFGCGQHRPEHAGTCYGNASCEIWVCGPCAPDVLEALAVPTEGDNE